MKRREENLSFLVPSVLILVGSLILAIQIFRHHSNDSDDGLIPTDETSQTSTMSHNPQQSESLHRREWPVKRFRKFASSTTQVSRDSRQSKGRASRHISDVNLRWQRPQNFVGRNVASPKAAISQDDPIIFQNELQEIANDAHREFEFLHRKVGLSEEQIEALEKKREQYLQNLANLAQLKERQHPQAEFYRQQLTEKHLQWMSNTLGAENYREYLNLTSR